MPKYVRVEVLLDIADNLVKQDTSFSVTITDKKSGELLDTAIAPLHIDSSELIIDCSSVNPEFIIDDRDAKKSAILSVIAYASPGAKVTMSVNGAALGVKVDPPEQTKAVSDSYAQFEFTFTTDNPVPLGQFPVAVIAMDDKGGQDNCILDFEVVQRLTVMAPATLQHLDYDTDIFIPFTVGRLRRVFENEKYLFFPDLFDKNGNRVDYRSLFRTYPSEVEVTFKTTLDGTAYGQIHVKARKSSEIGPFIGRIQLVAIKPDFVLYNTPDPYIDIAIP